MSRAMKSSRVAMGWLALLAMVVLVGCEPPATPPATQEPAAEETPAEPPAPDQASVVEPAPSEEAKPEEAAAPAEEAKPEAAPAEEMKPEEAAKPAEEAKPEAKAEAKPEEPTRPALVTVEALKKAELLCELPDSCNTPDGMAVTADGAVILSAPNFNDRAADAALMKITPDNKVEVFYTFPDKKGVKRVVPMGICAAPSGDLYLADNQLFEGDKGQMLFGKSRLVRIVVKDGKPTDLVPVVSGFNVSNAVVVRDGFVYVSETILDPKSAPLLSGIFRFKLDEEGITLKEPLKDDPHLIATILTNNPEIPFGADGLCFDAKGNLYCGNFADGTLHKLELDKDGKAVSNEIFAKAPHMRSCDGICYDAKTDQIYVADSLANAVQVISMDGKVETLAQDPESDGSGGKLDQPCEVLLRGREVIVSNMDWPVPTGVNTKFDKPYTLSVIKLE